MPSQPTSQPASPSSAERLAAQQAQIDALERALWADDFDDQLLAAYQQAHRDLEALIDSGRGDDRHAFVLVVPVADSPRQLQTFFTSLLTLCRTFGYGGQRDGRFHRVSVLLADDSSDPGAIVENRSLAVQTTASGVAVEYFGIDQQLALLSRIDSDRLQGVIGDHDPAAFGRKGQAVMRNIAALRLAEIARQRTNERLIFYTVDVDQTFRVCVPDTNGRLERYAISYFHRLDDLFDRNDIQMLTGKVVGDPPVSPAVMAANFLDDVDGFLTQIAQAGPDAPYAQPGHPKDGDAAYHDMADLFGFAAERPAYRYRSISKGSPSNAVCFDEFANRLNGFFHGEHPTRTTWFSMQHDQPEVIAARTVYTGNTAFSASALDWFVPFAPLRLRMSGPTMGRLLKAAIGDRFVSANLPMLHSRVLADVGKAEFRPGVVEQAHGVDLADEFERQYYGDRMLFTVERLVEAGYPDTRFSRERIVEHLDTVGRDLRERYATKQAQVSERVDRIDTRLKDVAAWWHRRAELTDALAAFGIFVDNIRHNFGADSVGLQRIDDPDRRCTWDNRQAAAISGFRQDQAAWCETLRRLRAD